MLTEGWTPTTLGEITEFLSGGTPSKDNPTYWDGVIPWVSAKDMKRLRLEDTEDHVNDEGVANGTRLVPKDTVFLLTRGMTLLNDVPISISGRPMTFNQDVKALRPKGGVRDDFLPYLLLGLKQRLLGLVDLAGHGTGRLNSDELKSLDVLLPPKSDQRAIAHVLGTLDDKIDLNRRMNETLEAIPRAIFKSWFVDFDPVRAKAEGQRPTGMDDETAAFFPDSFEDSQLGEIPRGWIACKLGDLVSIARESLSPNEHPDELFDHYSIPAFDGKRWPKTETGEQIKSNKFVVPPSAVLLSKLNPRFPRVWLSATDGTRRSICSTEFLVVLPNSDTPLEYIYGLFTSDSFRDGFAALVTGTSSSHQRVNAADLLRMDVVIPSHPLLFRYGELVKALHKQVIVNLRQYSTLETIRDTLLPKLLSGEIRVKEAEKVVERAV